MASLLNHRPTWLISSGARHYAGSPSSNLSIVSEHPTCGFKPLNEYQEKAVREALVKPLTLVQGPPGES